MNRLLTTRRLPITLATLALLALPIGCGSEVTTTAEMPTPPTVVVEAPPALITDPSTAPGAMPGTLDQSVQRSASELQGEAHHAKADARLEVREAEGEVKQAVEDVEGDTKRQAKEIEAEARKTAEDALNRLLPSPK